MKYFNFLQHQSSINQRDLLSICNPLFNNFPLNFFGFNRVYKDGTRFFLTSDDEFYQWVYKNKCSVATAFDRCIHDGYYFSVETKKYLPKNEYKINEKQLTGARNIFNHEMDKGFTIIQHYQPDYCEIYDFACPTNAELSYEFYSSHLDILKHFIRYFKYAAKNIIALSEKHRILNPNNIKHLHKNSMPINVELLKAREAFFNQTHLKTYPTSLNDDCKIEYLSQQEINCLIYLARGRTASEIGKVLRLSPKTVESYIMSAKNKLNCYKKSQLIDQIFAIDLIDIDYLKWLIANENK